ncbi:hypothetical protein B7759_03620 [Burkholderia glumae]|nr:hypothetical protein CG017_03637 [Burkholderia glumae]QTP34998.1 hypothetical protein B7759_03620 [Burkholderia glumae]
MTNMKIFYEDVDGDEVETVRGDSIRLSYTDASFGMHADCDTWGRVVLTVTHLLSGAPVRTGRMRDAAFAAAVAYVEQNKRTSHRCLRTRLKPACCSNTCNAKRRPADMALSTYPSKHDSQLVRRKAMKAGMSEDQYKDWLLAHFGVRSAAELSAKQRREAHARRHKLLDLMKPQAAPGAWNEPQPRKLSALWAQLAACGAVGVNTPTALESWATGRIPTPAALRFARAGQLPYLIEAAKKWLLRVQPDAEVTA